MLDFLFKEELKFKYQMTNKNYNTTSLENYLYFPLAYLLEWIITFALYLRAALFGKALQGISVFAGRLFVKDSSLDNTGQDPLALNNSQLDFSQPCSPEEGEDPENENSDLASEKQKSPIYPHPPVKIFYKVAESRKEILREYKNKCIIYM